jgi:hypothetical protein
LSPTSAYLSHYNSERPNQARSCGNQPPCVACPTFPRLPAVPQTVDPDRWLMQIDQQALARTIRANGKVTINREDYYVSRSLAGRRVTCWVNAAQKQFDIWQPGRCIKSIPIKGEASADDALRGGCSADEARGALGIPAVSAHPSQAHPGPAVGLSLPSVQREESTHLPHKCSFREAASLCLLFARRLFKRAAQSLPAGEDQRPGHSPSLSSLIDRLCRAFSKLITRKNACLLYDDVGWRTAS